MTIEVGKQDPWEALAAPFGDDEIEWRVQRSGKGKQGPWALIVPYVTNRAIQNRLDQVVGPGNWTNSYETFDTYWEEKDGHHHKTGILCSLSIQVDGMWISRQDGADVTDIEPVKGGLSNAMKRAAVQFGMGRFLYELPTVWAIFDPDGDNMVKIDGETHHWNAPLLDTLWGPGKEDEKEHWLQEVAAVAGDLSPVVKDYFRGLVKEYRDNAVAMRLIHRFIKDGMMENADAD